MIDIEAIRARNEERKASNALGGEFCHHVQEEREGSPLLTAVAASDIDALLAEVQRLEDECG
jgi:hypothetical protein